MSLPWSAESAALELHSGLDLKASNAAVMKYFREQLQAAYDRGRHDGLRSAESECEEIGEKFGAVDHPVVSSAGMCATRIRKLIAASIN